MINPRQLPVALFVTLVLLFIEYNIRCQTILAPSNLFIGERNKFLLISDSDSDAYLKTSFDYNSLESQPNQTISFKKGQLIEWDLFIDNNLENRNILFVRVVFGNGRKIDEQFKLSPASGFVLLQSDKPIYRVSEQVKFRAIRIDSTLTPVQELMILRIRNNQEIIVEEVELETKPPTFIAEYLFSFPLIAKPGIWKAELLYGPNFILKQSISLEITEYVLPLFHIDILTPKYIFNMSNPAEIITNVTYTYGKPVKGSIYYRFGFKEKNRYSFIASSNTFCLKNGVNKFTYNIEPFKLINLRHSFKSQFCVEAVVSDYASEKTDRAINDRTLIVNSPYVISLENTILEYKPTVAHYITFEVTNPYNEPVADVPLNITLLTEDETNIQPYIVTSLKDKLKTDKSGKVVFTFSLSENRGNLNAFVQTNDPKYENFQANASFLIKPFNSSESAFISISNKKKFTYLAGERFQSLIAYQGGVNLSELYLIVISKGVFIYSIKLTSPHIDFELTNKMVPSIRILIISFSELNKKIVSDSFRLFVQQAECGVDVRLTNKRILPGSNATFIFKGNTNDVVGIHAIDEAVYLLRNQKFASRSNYKQILVKNDLGCGPGGGSSSVDIIHKSGLKILSANLLDNVVSMDSSFCKPRLRQKRTANALNDYYFIRKCCLLAYLKYTERKPCNLRAEAVKRIYNNTKCSDEFIRCCRLNNHVVFGASAGKTNNAVVEESILYYKIEDELMKNSSFIRSDFRDTWLFDVVLLNDSIQKYSVPTPHSITSWFISTISITPKHGLCLNGEHRITTFKQFFIKISLPLVIIQHEHTQVVVTIFNYFNERLHGLTVTFNGDENICTESGTPGIKFRKYIPNIPANSDYTITFPFVPLAVGIFNINITAISQNKIGDKVVKKITVLPPGTNEDKFLSFDLDPSNIVKRETKVATDHIFDETLPEIEYQHTQIKLHIHDLASSRNGSTQYLNIVPNTTRYIITALGERFSPRIMDIEGLSELIKKPKGCGEQNMYYMAFNLYTLMYLEAVQKLSSTTRDRGIKYLKRALRQQLSFRHTDGSFSAFDRRPSSVWLTAFVSKVICQASPFLGQNLDETIINGAIKWLLNKQSSDGSFIESYPVLHENALGGVKGKTALTAYLHIALNECDKYLNEYKIDRAHINLKTTIKKTENYLKNNINNLKSLRKVDSYSLALIAYAFSFNRNLIEIRNINDMLIENLNLRSKQDRINNLKFWPSEYPVETASYALLSLIKLNENNVLDHISISNWLSSMQINGTFDNTQNTVVALEALSKYYSLYKKENDNMIKLYSNVSFNSKFKRSIEFDNRNSDILQTFAVDPGTRKIDFETRGNGLGKVNVLIIYNVFKPNGTCQFDLDVNISEFKPVVMDNKNQFNESTFFGPDIKKELGEIIEHSNEIMDCSNPNILRTKRFIRNRSFFNTLISSFLNRDRNLSTMTSIPTSKPTKNRNKATENNQIHDLPPLPNLSIDNPVIRLLNICVQRLVKEQSSDMTLLEVRILSGYQPINDDLEFIKNDDKNYLEAYENTNSKVSFYFGAIPYGRRNCIKFRIYQSYNVQHIQSALVRIYSYYSKEWGCSRLYSDIRVSNYLQYQCNNDNSFCRCVTKSKCPNNEPIEEIVKLKMNQTLAEIEFSKLVYAYSNVLFGTITDNDVSFNDFKSPVYTIKPTVKIRGDDIYLRVMLNYECGKIELKRDTVVIVMHNQKHAEQVLLLEGNSIFFPINNHEHYATLSSLFSIYQRRHNLLN